MLKREPNRTGDQVKVTFILPNNPAQPRISVVGDFNAWDPEATPLVKRSNNTRSASVTLEPSKRYAFRYYAADGSWLNDEAADAYETNEHGSQNCIIIT
jgi:hypothetical protein